MSTVIVENIGPVKKLRIPVPENGGLVVLRGRNGAGKTRTLEGIESLASGNGRISVRDGALNGRIAGFGACMTVARSTRRSGELEVVTLDGKLNAADLVDPGIKSPEAADAHRIRALIQTAGIEGDASLFWPLFGGQAQFESLASKAIKQDADPVELASRIKREVEAAARTEEAQAQTALGHARAHRESAGDVRPEEARDANELQRELEEAIRARSDVESLTREARDAHRQAAMDRQRLASIVAPVVPVARATARETTEALSAFEADVAAAEHALRRAIASRDVAREKATAAAQALENAEAQQILIDGLNESILKAEAMREPNEQELENSELRVAEAQKAVEDGVRIRDALQRMELARKHQQEAENHAARASLLRDAARGTDEVLSGMVANLGTGLRVEAGRLVLKTDRGDTYFGDLSHGERWKIAIDLCVDQVGAAGLLVIPQEAFEGLDPQNRSLIARHAEARGVIVMTAEASDDEEITAEVFA